MNLTQYIQDRLTTRKILLMTHAVVGYPSLEANWQMLEIMEEVGVDLVELQLPFSEPIADGPIFVQANQQALEQGTHLDQYFDLMKRATANFSFPHLMMGYYNSAFRMGHEGFCRRVQESGGVGYILPDLPFEEYGDLTHWSQEYGLTAILMMTPTNRPERLAQIGQRAQGFIYGVARRGVTGKKTELDESLKAAIAGYRKATDLPLGLGFGLSSALDLRQLQGVVEIGIVGSELLRQWNDGGATGYRDFLRQLTTGCF